MRGFLLSHQDSNLGKQNQNLMCYHYTMGHSKNGCKSNTFSQCGQIYFIQRLFSGE